MATKGHSYTRDQGMREKMISFGRSRVSNDHDQEEITSLFESQSHET